MRRIVGDRRGRIAAVVLAVAAVLTAVTVLAVTGNREPAAAVKLLNGDAWLSNTHNGGSNRRRGPLSAATTSWATGTLTSCSGRASNFSE